MVLDTIREISKAISLGPIRLKFCLQGLLDITLPPCEPILTANPTPSILLKGSPIRMKYSEKGGVLLKNDF
jgi:hypothetical protein